MRSSLKPWLIRAAITHATVTPGVAKAQRSFPVSVSPAPEHRLHLTARAASPLPLALAVPYAPGGWASPLWVRVRLGLGRALRRLFQLILCLRHGFLKFQQPCGCALAESARKLIKIIVRHYHCPAFRACTDDVSELSCGAKSGAASVVEVGPGAGSGAASGTGSGTGSARLGDLRLPLGG